MDEVQYFKERLDHQIEWYDGKSASCQNWYKFIKIIIGLLSLLIAPMGLLLQDFACVSLIIAILGLIIATGTFILSLNKYHEKSNHMRTFKARKISLPYSLWRICGFLLSFSRVG